MPVFEVALSAFVALLRKKMSLRGAEGKVRWRDVAIPSRSTIQDEIAIRLRRIAMTHIFSSSFLKEAQALLFLSSCEVIGGIFKAEFYVGVAAVLIIVALIIYLFVKFRGGSNR